MRKRRMIGLSAAALLLAAAGAFAFDYLQIGRTEPSLKPEAERADYILVEKSARRLTLLRQGRPIATYPVSLGFAPLGDKQREGDGRTPEGRYQVEWKNPVSVAHLSLKVSYPDENDRAQAQAAGVEPGGDIMIHGLMNGFSWVGALHRKVDWTQGCIGVTNAEMAEIYASVDVGTPIEIRP